MILILIFQDIIQCALIIHQIPKEEVCACFIKTTYLLLDVMICLLYLNVLPLRLKLEKKSIFFTCNYKSPSQAPDEFEKYCQIFHLTLSNKDDLSPVCSIVIGDFNVKCRNWWAWHVNSNAGKELDFLTSTAGYTQLIDKPIHFFSGGSSYIDLILQVWNS